MINSSSHFSSKQRFAAIPFYITDTLHVQKVPNIDGLFAWPEVLCSFLDIFLMGATVAQAVEHLNDSVPCSSSLHIEMSLGKMLNH